MIYGTTSWRESAKMMLLGAVLAVPLSIAWVYLRRRAWKIWEDERKEHAKR